MQFIINTKFILIIETLFKKEENMDLIVFSNCLLSNKLSFSISEMCYRFSIF